MNLTITPRESATIHRHLQSYIDNQRDKPADGIGSDQIDLIDPILEGCAERTPEMLDVSLLQMAHVRAALVTHGEDDPDARAIVERIDTTWSPGLLMSCGPQTPQEAEFLAYCLNVYMDNEADKAPYEGFEGEIAEKIEVALHRWSAGNADCSTIDMMLLAHVLQAADLYAEDAEVDYKQVHRIIERAHTIVGHVPPDHRHLPQP